MLKNSKKCLDSVNEVRNCSLKWIDSKLTRNKKSFFGTTYAFGKTINTHLIGQLSKNYTNGNDKLISGDLLIELTFERIKEKNMLSPSPVIHIDCKDESKLKQFYEKMGFVYFKKNEDKDLLMYLMPMKKVKDADFTNERWCIEHNLFS